MSFNPEQYLQPFADLAVQVGLNLRAGQRLLVFAPIETAPFVRCVAESAYKAGARLVEILWQDDQTRLIRFQHAPRDSFEEYPEWMAQARLDAARRGDALLMIDAEDPDLLNGQDPRLIDLAQKTSARYKKTALELQARFAFNWSIISYPIPSWAAKVFPNLPPDEQMDKLWNAILETCRLKQADPVMAWKKHISELAARADDLNRKQYSALHFYGAGSDVTFGLPQGHIWMSGAIKSQTGIQFVPNLPTEEVFTMPHKDRTEGIVRATRPLSIAGKLIEDFSVTFERGHVVKISARENEDILRNLVATDEGAARLGEVALVPASSPISRMGLLFYNTLFDENAACHIALGEALPTSLSGGDEMSAEEFAAAGGNDSLVHVDFMIGSPETDIDGISAGGAVEPVMRQGEWV